MLSRAKNSTSQSQGRAATCFRCGGKFTAECSSEEIFRIGQQYNEDMGKRLRWCFLTHSVHRGGRRDLTLCVINLLC